MKKKLITGGSIIIIILLCGAIIQKTLSTPEEKKCKDTQESASYVPSDTTPSINNYFQASLPSEYSITYDKSVFEAIFHYKGEELGYLSFYTSPEKNAQSFVSCIEGMHAYPKDDGNDFNMNSYLIKKVIVSYELSAAESEEGKVLPKDETHYYFYSPDKNNDNVGDLYVKSGIISSKEMDELAKSIIPTKESNLY